MNCGPRGLPHGDHSLYHNNGDGTFTDVTAAAGIAKPDQGYGLTAVAADFDNDGWPDIYVACDSTPSLLFRNNHDGTFREDGLERGVALSEDGMEQAGMGIAIGDFRLEGNLDMFKTHFAEDTPALYQQQRQRRFQRRDHPRRPGRGDALTSAGARASADLDNDGNPDLFLVTGSIYPELQGPATAPTPRVIFRNLGKGQFEELVGDGRPRRGSRACQPRLRLRRLR